MKDICCLLADLSSRPSHVSPDLTQAFGPEQTQVLEQRQAAGSSPRSQMGRSCEHAWQPCLLPQAPPSPPSPKCKCRDENNL